METGAPVSGDWRRLQRWRGYFDSVAFLLLAMLRKVATPVLVRFLSVKKPMVQWSIGFLQGRKQGIRDPFPFSPFLCIYFFWRNLVSYRDEIWAGVMFPFLTLCLLGGFCFIYSVFFFFGLIALFFWVFLLPSGAAGCSISGFLFLLFLLCIISLFFLLRSCSGSPFSSALHCLL